MGCHLSVQVKPWSPGKGSPKVSKKGMFAFSPPSRVHVRKSVGTRGIVDDPSVVHAVPPPATKVALCVGINAYKHFPALKCAEHDAKDVAAQFETNGFVVRTLLGREATRDNLLRQLEWCVHSGNTFVVALFGHGVERRQAALFVPVDATSGEFEGDKIHTDVLRGLSKRSKAASGLFIFDCCFSGTFLQRASRAPSWVGRLAQEKSRIVITSGMSGEVVDDDDGSGHSPFASSFLVAMKEAPASEELSAIQLFVRIRSECINRFHGSVIPLLGRFPGDTGGDTFIGKSSS